MEVGNQGLREEIKGTKPRREKRLRRRNKGCRKCSGATENIEEKTIVRGRKVDGEKQTVQVLL